MNRIVILLLALIGPFAYAIEVPLGRLPGDVIPNAYELSLRIFPESERFSGTVRIHVNIQRSTSVIWLHGQDLQVQDAKIVLKGKEVTVRYTQVHEEGVSRLDLPEPVGPQQAILSLTYEAPFNRKLEGLYRLDHDGKSYAFTQFEAISARRCFPSFDQPEFKTPFTISLTVPKGDEAITNTLPVEELAAKDGSRQIRFATTKKLPAYLIAFAVGPFDVVKGPDVPPNEFRKEPLPLRGIAVKGEGHNFTYALANAGSIITVLEKYMGIGYPFSKLDLIAIPDFEWGAMENAGAITFRDTLLFLDENSSYRSKKSYANVMAHEVGHQWFGNLVTMKWWDDIWLNEGLTSWIDGKAVQIWNPSYKTDVAAVQSAIDVMDIDSTDSTHPVYRPVQSGKDVASIADSIIFSKGAALPLMFEHYLGESKFQKVIRHYLKQHEYSNVSSPDFLNAVNEVAGKETADSFHTFLFQSGVPYVEAQTVCRGKTGMIHLKQSRYAPLGSKLEDNQLWQIPMCIRFSLNGKVSAKCLMMTQREQDVLLSDVGCPDWIMPNADGTGYYRWSLPGEGFRQMTTNARLSISEQLSVIDSIKSGFATGHLSSVDTLAALTPFATSDAPEIAMAPVATLQFFRDYLLQSSDIAAFEKYARKLYRPAFQKLGFAAMKNESDETKQFRADLIEFLALVAQDPEVRKEAAQRGRAYAGFPGDGKVHPEVVDSNLVQTSLSVAVQETGTDFVHALLSLLKNSNDSLLRRRILTALGRSTDPAVVQKAQQLVLDPSLRTNEITTPLESQIDEVANRPAVWKFLQENFDTLTTRLSLSEAGRISLLTSKFCSQENAEEVNQFFSPRVKTLAGGPNYLKRTVDTVNLCAAKVQAHRQDAATFFNH